MSRFSAIGGLRWYWGVTFGLTTVVNLTIGQSERERQRVALQRLTQVNEPSRSGVIIQVFHTTSRDGG